MINVFAVTILLSIIKRRNQTEEIKMGEESKTVIDAVIKIKHLPVDKKTNTVKVSDITKLCEDLLGEEYQGQDRTKDGSEQLAKRLEENKALKKEGMLHDEYQGRIKDVGKFGDKK